MRSIGRLYYTHVVEAQEIAVEFKDCKEITDPDDIGGNVIFPDQEQDVILEVSIDKKEWAYDEDTSDFFYSFLIAGCVGYAFEEPNASVHRTSFYYSLVSKKGGLFYANKPFPKKNVDTKDIELVANGPLQYAD